MAVNPVSGKVYVANTDARNDVRFEGHNPALASTSVRGHIVDSRITVIDPEHAAASCTTTSNCTSSTATPATPAEPRVPAGHGVSRRRHDALRRGAGLGEARRLRHGRARGRHRRADAANQSRCRRRPDRRRARRGKRSRAYVLTRFDNGISIVDPRPRAPRSSHVEMFNPEPASVIDGRPFLYDATAHLGERRLGCASCHIGGDFDSLAWDLGNPGGAAAADHEARPCRSRDRHEPTTI